MGWFRRTDDLYAPLPPWADGALIGHLDHDGRDMSPRIGWPGMDRRRFESEIFDAARTKDIPSFDNCTFVRCTFEGSLDLRFHKCRFVDCNFLCGNADGITTAQKLVFDCCEMRGRVGGGILDDRNQGSFARVRLIDSRFDNCLLDRIHFGHTIEFENVRLYKVRGLPSCGGLDQVQVAERGRELLNSDLIGAPVSFLDRLASWERLRAFGRLPLFGTSLTALVAIPLLFFGLAIYNDQLDQLQHWSLQDGVERRLSDMLLALQPIPLPALSFWLLVSTLLLGVAATLFALACPPRVREFSLERWTDELRQSALRYLPLSWSGRLARAIAAPCYLIGGGGTLAILLVKLWNAGTFILANSTLPW